MGAMGGMLGGYGIGNRIGAVENFLGHGNEMVHGVQNSFQGVMQTIARVSGLMEELMRNFHMIFESVFGLIYSVGAFREEMGMFAPSFKGGFFRRLLGRAIRKLLMLWRFVFLLAIAPFTHRFSPVKLILRICGLAPPQIESAEQASFSTDEAAEAQISGNDFITEGRNERSNSRHSIEDVELPNL
eukprot:Plantae.Rhodophyta-Purpureofilum_apyrenoidigerum.ctg51668.p1 GENE.Plantae.Rhodophyta-Purpureofilum_apyrenoidigerum.ctg51668~~Plantae.Rhodophyta-Purpureofilum_apyrenoidigerum.ctg51668.p1  ORF type:complete len:186 (-),score=24.63 Plantae.Rhodophyta-Purpureofilum_apyrenoidigerum.ctg51668:118-675(-)